MKSAGLQGLWIGIVTAVGLWVLPTALGQPLAPGSDPSPTSRARSATPPAKPLAGVLVAIDPGHQLGNRNFASRINRLVDAGGGVRKTCNTTGTATAAGYPEATFAWRVAVRMRAQLRQLGARVQMTRNRNSDDLWGPCVDVRGRFPNRVGADVMISLHGDGVADTEQHGFHVIVPGRGRAQRSSLALGQALRTSLSAKVPASSQVADGLVSRSDLGTLNFGRMPRVMLELGNMRNLADARRMSRAEGQGMYATAIVTGLRTHLR